MFSSLIYHALPFTQPHNRVAFGTEIVSYCYIVTEKYLQLCVFVYIYFFFHPQLVFEEPPCKYYIGLLNMCMYIRNCQTEFYFSQQNKNQNILIRGKERKSAEMLKTYFSRLKGMKTYGSGCSILWLAKYILNRQFVFKRRNSVLSSVLWTREEGCSHLLTFILARNKLKIMILSV